MWESGEEGGVLALEVRVVAVQLDLRQISLECGQRLYERLLGGCGRCH